MSRMASATVRALCVASVLVLAAPAASTGAKPRRSACQRLRGADLAPARNIKLVEHANIYDGKNLLGCVLPRGALRKVTYSVSSDSASVDYEVRRLVGPVVLLETSDTDPLGGTSQVSVYHLRTGVEYTIASACVEYGAPGEECPNPPTEDHLDATVLDRQGRSAIAATSGDGTSRSIASFSSTGVRSVLDSGTPAEIPASSLKLTGSTVTWTHAGQPRSAEL